MFSFVVVHLARDMAEQDGFKGLSIGRRRYDLDAATAPLLSGEQDDL